VTGKQFTRNSATPINWGNKIAERKKQTWKQWKCKVNTCTGTGLSKRQEASGRRGLARGRTDHRPTTTQHRQRRPTLYQVKAARTWQPLDRRHQKDGVSTPSRYADNVPKQTSRRRYSNGPCRRRKQRQRRGHSQTTIRWWRTSVRQLRPSTPPDPRQLSTLRRHSRTAIRPKRLYINSVKQLPWLLSFTT